MHWLLPGKGLTQEKVVVIMAAALFIGFSIFLTGFFSVSNLIGLVRNICVLGILGVGMGLVIIGRGIDLSVVSVLAISAAYFIELLGQGLPIWSGFLFVLMLVILVGAINGFLVAYGEIPPIFATLAMGLFVYGFGRSQLMGQDVAFIPPEFTTLLALGTLKLWGVPLEVFVFVAVCLVATVFLKFTKFGRYVYYIGDNFAAARNLGIPVRPMLVLQYVACALFASVAGAIVALNLQSMNTRIVNSTLLYDVILIVVLGGIGLSGGKGGIRNVVFGALLIGILVNAMTILDFEDTHQNLIKALILLAAIMTDTLLNQRDEQTEKQGDI
ncbi:MAG: ABC transporter permease [Thiotrichales bacterium]|nr:ABC transporter permease [Thiotrichales bacterium]MCY4285350.1 ABC transporter permease [Thiotrichales bacterium]MCY4348978.1 ABC transporter permease [Thiotrichales bacterium]